MTKMTPQQQVVFNLLNGVRLQEEWMQTLERCVRACGVVPTAEHREWGLPLYQSGRTPYAACAEMGVVI